MPVYERAGIRVLAISPDPVDILRRFSDKYSIAYPLLSDAESRVIRDYGLLNEDIEPEHEWYGIPRPGAYLVAADGTVADKSFYESHQVRASAEDMLYRGFGVEYTDERTAALATPHLKACASFVGGSVRRQQVVRLAVRLDIGAGLHVYGSPLPEGYISLEITVRPHPALEIGAAQYPENSPFRFEALDETVPAYSGRVEVGFECRGVGDDRDEALEIDVELRYQACDDEQCFMPETLMLRVPLRFLPHDWERLEG